MTHLKILCLPSLIHSKVSGEIDKQEQDPNLNMMVLHLSLGLPYKIIFPIKVIFLTVVYLTTVD